MTEQTISRIRKFTADRDWDQFHTPSNLAKSISIEANELLECFQWSDEDYDIEGIQSSFVNPLEMIIFASYYVSAKVDKKI